MFELITKFIKWLVKVASGFFSWAWGIVVALVAGISSFFSWMGDFVDQISVPLNQIISKLSALSSNTQFGEDNVGVFDLTCYMFGFDFFGSLFVWFLGLVGVYISFIIFSVAGGMIVLVYQTFLKFALRVKGLIWTS